MMFMNSPEIDRAVHLLAKDPVMRKATQLLLHLRDLANQVSDGWAYWPKPCRASRKLQELIQQYLPCGPHPGCEVPATMAQLRKAAAPIKAFLTRERKTDWPTLDVEAILSLKDSEQI